MTKVFSRVVFGENLIMTPKQDIYIKSLAELMGIMSFTKGNERVCVNYYSDMTVLNEQMLNQESCVTQLNMSKRKKQESSTSPVF
jgi:hypothetical protein